MFVMNKKTRTSKHRQELTFWETIRAIRKAKGITQEELAEAISENADAPWISRVETGKKDISFRTALKIVHALGAEMFVDGFKINDDG